MSNNYLDINRNLAGAQILITRCQSDAADLTKHLIARGAKVSCSPMIDVKEADIKNIEVKIALEKAQKYICNFDWIFLTSKNAVKYFLASINILKKGNVKIAAVGEQTASAVRALGWPVDFVADGNGVDAFILQFKDRFNLAGKKIIHPCSNLIAKYSAQLSIKMKPSIVTTVEAYRVDLPETISSSYHLLKNNIIVFASPSAVTNFASLIKNNKEISNMTIVTIGATTFKAALSHLSTFVKKKNVTKKNVTNENIAQIKTAINGTKTAGIKTVSNIFKSTSPNVDGLVIAIEKAWNHVKKERKRQ